MAISIMFGGENMDGKLFNGVNILGKSLDARWLRNQVISNNIANVDTPGYKRKDVNFENYLQQELKLNKKNININALNPTVFTDNQSLEYRMDGNNVDVDTEMINLTKNQLRYSTLIDQVKQDFSRIKIVLNSK